jgi:hypothetical protein
MKNLKRPYWVTYGLIFIVSAALGLIFIPREKQDTLRIGLFKTRVNQPKEMDSIISYFESYPFLKYRIIDLSKKNAQFPKLKKFDALWYHQLDTGNIPKSFNNEKINGSIKTYLNKGGSLLLTMEALKHIKNLKLENSPVSSEQIEVKDKGYGRRRGLHAKNHHPVFKGLDDGLYIFSPKNDTTTRQVGFMGENPPKNGKIIGVDWANNIKEDTKLMIEYEIDKGKVICIGAYTIFHQPNNHKTPFEMFMNNVFGYLGGI